MDEAGIGRHGAADQSSASQPAPGEPACTPGFSGSADVTTLPPAPADRPRPPQHSHRPITPPDHPPAGQPHAVRGCRGRRRIRLSRPIVRGRSGRKTRDCRRFASPLPRLPAPPPQIQFETDVRITGKSYTSPIWAIRFHGVVTDHFRINYLREHRSLR